MQDAGGSWCSWHWQGGAGGQLGTACVVSLAASALGTPPDCDEVTQESQEQLRAVPATAAVSSPRPCCRHPGGCSPMGTSPSHSAPRRKVTSSFGGRRGEEGVRQGRGSRKEREGTQGKPRTELFLGEQPGRCGAVQTQTQGEFRSSDRGGEAGCYNGTRTPGTAPHHASCTGAADVIPQ